MRAVNNLWTRRTRIRLATGLTALCLAAGAVGCAPAVVTDTASAPPPSTGANTPAGSTPAGTPTTQDPPTSTAPTSEAPATTPSAPESPSTTEPTDSGNASAILSGTNHNAAAKAYAYPAKQVLAWLEGDAKPTEKIVFLTFDDGPNHVVTPKVLDALKAGGAHGTFFVVGSVIDDAPDMLKRSVAEGNSIATHSWSHNYKKLYPGRKGNAERIISEYDQIDAKLRDVLGAGFKTSAWRYPGGHMSWKNLGPADQAFAAKGVYWIDWNSMTGDAEPKRTRPTTVSGMVQMATAPISAGQKVAVVLAHDTPDKKLTVKSLPQIIEAYKKAGYTFGVIA